MIAIDLCLWGGLLSTSCASYLDTSVKRRDFYNPFLAVKFVAEFVERFSVPLFAIQSYF